MLRISFVALLATSLTLSAAGCGSSTPSPAPSGGADAGADSSTTTDGGTSTDGGISTDTPPSCECSTDADCAGAAAGVCSAAICNADCACEVIPPEAGGPCNDNSSCTNDSCLPEPSCAGGGAVIGGRCYQVVSDPETLDWDAAAASCEASGGSLASIGDASENEGLRDAIAEGCGAEPAYIGLSYAAGAYSWADGGSTDYLNLSSATHAEGGAVMAADGTWQFGAVTATCYVCEAATQPFTCEYTQVAASDPAASAEVCNGVDDDCDGVADNGGSALCDDGNPCTVGACGGEEGCAWEPVDCDDGIGCTVDTCDPSVGCVHTPDESLCDDGVDCTVETCDALLGCTSMPNDTFCDDGQDCTADDICDEAEGCIHVIALDLCDDGFACTTETCTPGEGCSYSTDDTLCSDGNVCTTDACVEGAGCVFAPVDVLCDDGNACTTVDSCIDGACVGDVPLKCDDGVVCTADQCDPGVGCIAPLETECSSPGPLGGLFQGTADLTVVTMDGIQEEGVNTCTLTISITIDASADPQLQGWADGKCEGDSIGLDGGPMGPFGWGWNPRITGSIGANNTLVGSVEWQSIFSSGFWLPTPFSIDATPDENGIVTATLNETVATDHQDLVNIWTGTLQMHRVLIEGTCCAPDGACAPGTDAECYAKGWAFTANDAGLCCFGEEDCQVTTEAECTALSGGFQVSPLGACCSSEGCDVGTEVGCEAKSGIYTPKRDCSDDNGDLLPDVCPVPTSYGAAAGCAGLPTGNDLVFSPGGLFDITLSSDAGWADNGGQIEPAGALSLVLPDPFGELAFPQGASLSVDCAGNTLTGSTPFPDLGQFPEWPALDATVTTPSVAFGFDFGHALEATVPIAAGRPYMYLQATSQTIATIGDNVAITGPGDTFELFVDPTDPAVLAYAVGDTLSDAAGEKVKALGLGVSQQGTLSWEGNLPLNNKPVHMNGHVWARGKFSLIPVPKIDTLTLDGDVIINVGDAVDLIEPVAKSLLAGDWAALEQALPSGQDVFDAIEIGSNANALDLNFDALSITVAQATWTANDGVFTFRGEGFSPGVGAGELMEALSKLTFQSTGAVWGTVTESWFRITTEADLSAGPFSLTGAQVIIDSDKGIIIKSGEAELDWDGFLDALTSIDLDCDFDNGFSCALGGVTLASFSGSFGDDGVSISAFMGLPVLGEVALDATVDSDGSFVLTGSATQGLPGFGVQSIAVTVSNTGLAISASQDLLGQTLGLSGSVTFDGDFAMTGTMDSTDLLGFNTSKLSVEVTNDGVWANGSMGMPWGSLSLDVVATTDIDDWELVATGTLAPFGYELGAIEATASAGDATLKLEGYLDIAFLGDAKLEGQISPNTFELTGTADLEPGGFELAEAEVELNSSGVRIAAEVDLAGLASIDISGEVETDGDFELTSSANVDLPVGLVDLSADATLKKSGSTVTLKGDAEADLGPFHFDSGYTIKSSGYFDWDATASVSKKVKEKVCIIWCETFYAKLSGELKARINSKGDFKVSIDADACIQGDDICVGAGGSVKSNGKVCVELLEIDFCFDLF